MRSHLITAFGGKGLAQPPNKVFQPTSTPPGIWSVGWGGVGVAAAELRRYAVNK